MNIELIVGGLITLAGGGFFGVLATGWFQRRKTGSEARLNNTSADISTAEFIKTWANELKLDNQQMREELREIRMKLTDKTIENQELKARIRHLEALVDARDAKLKKLTSKV